MKRLPKILVATAVLGLSGIAIEPFTVPASAQSAPTQIAAKEQTQSFTIENMTCASCPITVRVAIEGVAGVKSVKVDFDAKTATVIYDPTIASVEAIAAASTNAGYPAKVSGS